MKQSLLRQLPQMDQLIADLKEHMTFKIKDQILKQMANAYLDSLRQGILNGEVKSLSQASIVEDIVKGLDALVDGKVKSVINGTGIVIHTNLGRSIYSETVLNRTFAKLKTYNNLEFDLETGRRGERYSLVESLITYLTGAEASIVVNNNAAAVLLVLSALAKGKKVLLSRGECVEIGGSFRLPDVMQLSGANLSEVGTTNKTHLKDYQTACDEDTAMILKVHTSNYKVVGFTSEVKMSSLVKWRHETQGHFVLYEDLGSGQLIESQEGEPTVRSSIEAGADLVSFSGDKLLGGPQAGIIVGKKDLIDQLKSHQLLRALRVDKASLLLLESTLLEYIKMSSEETIPTQRYLNRSGQEIKSLVQRFINQYQDQTNIQLTLKESQSQVGGGSLPLKSYASYALVLEEKTPKHSVSQMSRILRKAPVPVIARIQSDQLLIDFRTIDSESFDSLIEAIRRLEVDDD